MNIRHSAKHLAALEPTTLELIAVMREMNGMRALRGNRTEMTMDEAEAMVLRVGLVHLNDRIAHRATSIRLVGRKLR